MTEPEPVALPSVSEPNLAAFEARLTRLEEPLQQSSRAADASREAEDRSWIARRIIWIFTGAIGAVLVLYFVEGLQSSQWANVAGQAADLIKAVVLPVVTLVLGFYFGSRSGKG